MEIPHNPHEKGFSISFSLSLSITEGSSATVAVTVNGCRSYAAGRTNQLLRRRNTPFVFFSHTTLVMNWVAGLWTSKHKKRLKTAPTTAHLLMLIGNECSQKHRRNYLPYKGCDLPNAVNEAHVGKTKERVGPRADSNAKLTALSQSGPNLGGHGGDG